jgi:hypothetical protein
LAFTPNALSVVASHFSKHFSLKSNLKAFTKIDVPDFKGGRPLMLKNCKANREGKPSGYLK